MTCRISMKMKVGRPLLLLILLLLVGLLAGSGTAGVAHAQLPPEEKEGSDGYRRNERHFRIGLAAAALSASGRETAATAAELSPPLLRRPAGEATAAGGAAETDASDAEARELQEEVSNDGTYPPAVTSTTTTKTDTTATTAATSAAALRSAGYQPRLLVVEGQPAHHGIASISSACTYYGGCIGHLRTKEFHGQPEGGTRVVDAFSSSASSSSSRWGSDRCLVWKRFLRCTTFSPLLSTFFSLVALRWN
jgi:hypothetical protein